MLIVQVHEGSHDGLLVNRLGLVFRRSQLRAANAVLDIQFVNDALQVAGWTRV